MSNQSNSSGNANDKSTPNSCAPIRYRGWFHSNQNNLYQGSNSAQTQLQKTQNPSHLLWKKLLNASYFHCLQVRILRHSHDGLIGFKMLALAFVRSTIKLDFVIFQKIGETRVEWKYPISMIIRETSQIFSHFKFQILLMNMNIKNANHCYLNSKFSKN